MRRWAGLLVVAILVTSCAESDMVSYRPAEAEVVPSAGCLAEDIYRELSGSWWGKDLEPPGPRVGYPPAAFQPVAVVRCELGLDNGLTSVDAVRLEGDIQAVTEAFSADSLRYRDGIFVSCVEPPEVPAGLWLVDDLGRGFRPAWPSTPCGIQDHPLMALAALEEVDRQVHPTGAPYSPRCGDVDEFPFQHTTPDEVAEAQQRGPVLFSALQTPIDDVRPSWICAGSERTLLSASDSVDLFRAVSDAPVAQACSTTATRIATSELRRPDGSGGGRVAFELDGCTRALGFGEYRQIPDEALRLLGSAS